MISVDIVKLWSIKNTKIHTYVLRMSVKFSHPEWKRVWNEDNVSVCTENDDAFVELTIINSECIHADTGATHQGLVRVMAFDVFNRDVNVLMFWLGTYIWLNLIYLLAHMFITDLTDNAEGYQSDHGNHTILTIFTNILTLSDIVSICIVIEALGTRKINSHLKLECVQQNACDSDIGV